MQRRQTSGLAALRTCLRPCLALLASLALAWPVQAAFQDEIQVCDNSLNERGEWGLELHVNTTPSGRSVPDYPGEVPPAHAQLRSTPELPYGLGRGLEAGL